jgi:hypothetical protein
VGDRPDGSRRHVIAPRDGDGMVIDHSSQPVARATTMNISTHDPDVIALDNGSHINARSQRPR